MTTMPAPVGRGYIERSVKEQRGNGDWIGQRKNFHDQ